jgi:hypothetical protein
MLFIHVKCQTYFESIGISRNFEILHESSLG